MYFSKVRIPDNPTDMLDNRPYMYPRLIHGLESQAVEASSYALMVLLSQGTNMELKNATSVMLWLQSMRNSIGGFSGTRVCMRRGKCLEVQVLGHGGCRVK